MAMTDISNWTASELMKAYASRRVSPVEAMEAFLARAATVNPVVNALFQWWRTKRWRGTRWLVGWRRSSRQSQTSGLLTARRCWRGVTNQFVQAVLRSPERNDEGCRSLAPE